MPPRASTIRGTTRLGCAFCTARRGSRPRGRGRGPRKFACYMWEGHTTDTGQSSGKELGAARSRLGSAHETRQGASSSHRRHPTGRHPSLARNRSHCTHPRRLFALALSTLPALEATLPPRICPRPQPCPCARCPWGQTSAARFGCVGVCVSERAGRSEADAQLRDGRREAERIMGDTRHRRQTTV
jgi:hypothetical protein